MYFPIGWPKYFSSKDVHCGELKSLKYNRDRSLLAVISDHSVCIWNNRVSMVYILHRFLIVIYTLLIELIPHRIMTVSLVCEVFQIAYFLGYYGDKNRDFAACFLHPYIQIFNQRHETHLCRETSL